MLIYKNIFVFSLRSPTPLVQGGKKKQLQIELTDCQNKSEILGTHPWFISLADAFYSAVRCSLNSFWPSRSWGWFWPVSPSGAYYRTTLGPPPSPGGGLLLSGLFPGRMVYFFPQSCAQELPWRPGCIENQAERERKKPFKKRQSQGRLKKKVLLPDSCSPLPLSLIYSYFIIVQSWRRGCERELN